MCLNFCCQVNMVNFFNSVSKFVFKKVKAVKLVEFQILYLQFFQPHRYLLTEIPIFDH